MWGAAGETGRYAYIQKCTHFKTFLIFILCMQAYMNVCMCSSPEDKLQAVSIMWGWVSSSEVVRLGDRPLLSARLSCLPKPNPRFTDCPDSLLFLYPHPIVRSQ